MKVRTHVRAGGTFNHNETLARAATPKGVRVKTRVRAGGKQLNHNETLAACSKTTRGLKIKTRVKAGGVRLDNHNETLVG
jgi:hypothetical protein